MEKIRENIIELNYYLLQYMLKGDEKKVDELRKEINSLIDLYLSQKAIEKV